VPEPRVVPVPDRCEDRDRELAVSRQPSPKTNPDESIVQK
jgi:hypothetical protein